MLRSLLQDQSDVSSGGKVLWEKNFLSSMFVASKSKQEVPLVAGVSAAIISGYSDTRVLKLRWLMSSILSEGEALFSIKSTSLSVHLRVNC